MAILVTGGAGFIAEIADKYAENYPTIGTTVCVSLMFNGGLLALYSL